MTSLRTTGEGLARALTAGVVEPDRVVGWADNQIAQLEDPPYSLIKASLALKDINALVTALRDLPGKCDLAEAQRQLFGHMHRALRSEPGLVGPIVRSLFSLVIEQELVGTDAEGQIYALDHDWDHALEGTFCDVGSVRADLEVFLATYGDEH